MEKSYTEKNYPDLCLFLGASFHQDWNCDYATPDESIRDYIGRTAGSIIVKAYLQLKQLLKEEHMPEEWESMIYNQMGVCFDYTVDGFEHTEWLEWVRQRMLYHAEKEQGLCLEEIYDYCTQYLNLIRFLDECFECMWYASDKTKPDEAIKISVAKSEYPLIMKVYKELKRLLKDEHTPEVWERIVTDCIGIRYDKASQGLGLNHKEWLEWVKGRILYYAEMEKALDLERETEEDKPLQTE